MDILEITRCNFSLIEWVKFHLSHNILDSRVSYKRQDTFVQNISVILDSQVQVTVISDTNTTGVISLSAR